MRRPEDARGRAGKGRGKVKGGEEEADVRAGARGVSAASGKIRRLVRQYPEFDLVDGPKKGRGVGGGDSTSGTVGVPTAGALAGRLEAVSFGGDRPGGGQSAVQRVAVRVGPVAVWTRPQESMIKTQIARVWSPNSSPLI